MKPVPKTYKKITHHLTDARKKQKNPREREKDRPPTRRRDGVPQHEGKGVSEVWNAEVHGMVPLLYDSHHVHTQVPGEEEGIREDRGG